ncbi:hypothetical protein [Streptomyces sp. NRRL F-5123]|uniref:hypothetical protein n=1 Tax=Streptomyces sp. NRRL F-5123 TaxID=1463856 RepID=UPI0004E12D31|nr:hypothetical protein [Streptomyces sp. NRRL F-5123]
MTEPRIHRITPTPLPDGADLGVEGYARQLLADVIGVLADRDDLREDLDRLLDTDAPRHDPHVQDTGSRDDKFIDDLVRALGPATLTIRMRTREAGRLAESLSEIADPLVVQWPWLRRGEVA